jgi:hypothetical protein
MNLQYSHEIFNVNHNQLNCISCNEKGHKTIASSKCLLNKTNLEKTIDISNQEFIPTLFDNEDSQSVTNSMTVEQIVDAALGDSLQVTQNDSHSMTVQQIVDAALGDSLKVISCKCGSTDHESTKYHLCRLNKTCKCGSNTHRRINHRNCPLNKRNPINSHANQVNDIEDLNEATDSQIIFETQYESG